jgi:hypothetical protein
MDAIDHCKVDIMHSLHSIPIHSHRL